MTLGTTLRYCLLSTMALLLAACDGGGDGRGPVAASCLEDGPHACKTGATEPLYTFQWALNYRDSYFNDYPDTFGGGLDLNVEPVHRQGIKGQGVKVLVLDTGTDLRNEDLAPNADYSMSWNFTTQQSDPYPVILSAIDDPHGTAVAGMIAAAQNGEGVMGIAPRVTLGAANYLQSDFSATTRALALGGAPWSSKAHIINAPYAAIVSAGAYDNGTDAGIPILRGLKQLRGGLGAIYVKGAGNSFSASECGHGHNYYDCTSPINDPEALEPVTITVAALNAFGQASSYSSAGPVIWITGLGGEFGSGGDYGEGKTGPYSGPTIFSTDLRGCAQGYSKAGEATPFLRGETVRDGVPDNPDCDYNYMNGTSAATPTISGVVALMLEANPGLSWRDVRDILRLSARRVDPDYIHASPDGNVPYSARMDLTDNTLGTVVGGTADIVDGSTVVPIDLGWQENAAGNVHSNWYGFGVPDAEKAVSLARDYRRDPSLGRSTDIKMAGFETIAERSLATSGAFPYGVVTLLGTFAAPEQAVDLFQLRLTAEKVCLGSMGIAVRSPSGTVSLLKLPNDHFRKDGVASFKDYGLSSVAFYGEPARGNWQVFLLAANPDHGLPAGWTPCSSLEGGGPAAYEFALEARIIAQ
ncbi:S8 family serine peptidase [Castellaniella sp. GW247-6E4]|uniref:S8 family serine peptidase n=1 Tax=Castellaniella sp. GW247-6E4 TaxID=3140380 RepID=UPI00331520E2